MKRFSFLIFSLLLSCSTVLHQAQKSYEAGDYRAAVRDAKIAVARDSTNAKAYFLLGQAYMRLGHLDSALAALEKASALDAENEAAKSAIFEIHKRYGDAFFEQKDYRQALAEYQLAMDSFPQDATIIEKNGDVYMAVGRQEKAKSFYLQAMEAGGDSLRLAQKLERLENADKKAEQLFQKGMTYFKKKRYEKARDTFQKALDIKPDHKKAEYYFHLSYGHRLYRKGTVNALWEAIKHYGLAARLKPESGEPHYFMGLAYNKKDKNEYDNAIWALEMSLKVDPDGPYAARAKKKIREIKKRKKLLEDFWGRGK